MKKIGLIYLFTPLLAFSMDMDFLEEAEHFEPAPFAVEEELTQIEDSAQEELVKQIEETLMAVEEELLEEPVMEVVLMEVVDNKSAALEKPACGSPRKSSNRPRVTHRDAPEPQRQESVMGQAESPVPSEAAVSEVETHYVPVESQHEEVLSDQTKLQNESDAVLSEAETNAVVDEPQHAADALSDQTELQAEGDSVLSEAETDYVPNEFQAEGDGVLSEVETDRVPNELQAEGDGVLSEVETDGVLNELQAEGDGVLSEAETNYELQKQDAVTDLREPKLEIDSISSQTEPTLTPAPGPKAAVEKKTERAQPAPHKAQPKANRGASLPYQNNRNSVYQSESSQLNDEGQSAPLSTKREPNRVIWIPRVKESRAVAYKRTPQNCVTAETKKVHIRREIAD